MAVLKLNLEEFDAIDYDLIAIHSTLEDYHLAYFLNKKLPILLSLSKQQIEVKTKEGQVFFSKFDYTDTVNEAQISLIQNKNQCSIKRKNNSLNLFLNKELEIEMNVFFIPELNKVDFFLKIEHGYEDLYTEIFVKKIKEINNISTVYKINPEKIKSKNNLIF